MAAPGPPWRPIPSQALKQFLGVSLQALANWRVRRTGPEPEPFIPGRGNKVHYCPNRVMAWLSGTSRPYWQYSADWLAARGVGVDEPSEGKILERIKLLEKMRVLD